MLPLCYLCHRVSRPADMLPAPTWSNMALSSSVSTRRIPTRFRRAASAPFYATAVGLLQTGIATPIRVLRILYHLGRVLDQRSSLPHYNRPFLAGHTSSDNNQIVSIVESERSGEQRNDFEVEAPVTASEVYHAAILSDATLDNLLAIFDVPEDHDRLNQTSREEGDLHPELDRSPYREFSIQTTPNSAMTPRNLSTSLPESVWDEPSGIIERTSGHLIKTVAAHPQQKQGTGSSGLISAPAASSCIRAGGDVIQGAVCENMSPEHAECPTFARRQANSRLPQPAKSGGKQQPSSDVRTVSANVNANADSPSRRNKLQRRPRVGG